MNILLVDDDAALRESISSVLAEAGHSVVEAENGRDAMEILRSGLRAGQIPDLIVLDMQMPVMDGWAFRLAQLLDPELASIPVVVCTSESEDRSAPGAAFLRKPIDAHALLQSVERVH